MYVPSWQVWYGAIPPEEIDAIIAECEKYPSTPSTMGPDEENSRSDPTYRRSDVSWIPPADESSHFIARIIAHYAYEANRNAFGFNLGPTVNDIQYTKYYGSDEGFYNWHIDTFFNTNSRAYDRKLSVIIQLTDPDEYEGGDFKFEGTIEAPDPVELRKKGTVLVFPSYTPHMVEPVTNGERRSIVSWIEGPRFI